MAKIDPIRAPAGAGELYQLLELLRNKDFYESRLADMEKMRLQVNELLGKYAKTRNIEKLEAQSIADRGQAEVYLKDARVTLQDARIEAKDERAKHRAEVKSLDERLRSQRVELQRASSDAGRILTSAKDEAGNLVAEAAANASETARRLSNAEKLEKELKEKTKKLKDLLKG